MDFSLLAAAKDNLGRHQSLLSSVIPVLKLLCLTGIGLILAHPRIKLVPRETYKLLSKLVFALFLPCLIFTELGKSVSLQNMRIWWFIPVNVIVSTILGCTLGSVVALICKPPPQYFRFTVIMTGFGNTGNLPLAMIGSVCHSDDHPFGPECNTNGVAYVSFAQWVAVILVYTLVYHMMEPPVEFYEIVPDEEAEELQSSADAADPNLAQETATPRSESRPLLLEAEWPGMHDKETEHSKKPFIAQIFGTLSSSSELPQEDTSSIRCLTEPRMVRKMRIVAERTPIKHVLQPPTIASLLAIIVGTVPHLQNFVFNEDSPVGFITDSLEILEAALVPSVMLVLGGLLSEFPSKSELGIRTTVGIVVARLLLLPLVGILVVGLALKLHIVSPLDKMYVFVLLLQYTTPTAILLGAVANLRNYGTKEACSLLFWQHILALGSLWLYVTIFFKLLDYF